MKSSTTSAILFWFITILSIATNLYLFVDFFTVHSVHERDLMVFVIAFSLLPIFAYWTLYE